MNGMIPAPHAVQIMILSAHSLGLIFFIECNFIAFTQGDYGNTLTNVVNAVTANSQGTA